MMNNFKYSILIFIAVMFSQSVYSKNNSESSFDGIEKVSGSIDVGGLINYLRIPQGGMKVHTIQNTEEYYAFVEVSLFEIVGKDENGTEVLKEVDTLSKNLLLGHTPNRLIIPPKGRRNIRLFSKAYNDSDKQYRLKFVPVLPSKESGFDVKFNTTTEAGVSMFISWSQLVILGKSDPSFDTKMEELGSGMSIHNQGDSYVLLKDIDICTEDKCRREPSIVVMAGEEFKLFVNDESIINGSFYLIEGEQSTLVKW